MGATAIERISRERKAYAIALALQKARITAANAAEVLDREEFWTVAAAKAGMKPPSMETRRLVVEALR